MVSVVHTLSFLCFLFSIYTADDGRNDDEVCRARKTTKVTVLWRGEISHQNFHSVELCGTQLSGNLSGVLAIRLK